MKAVIPLVVVASVMSAMAASAFTDAAKGQGIYSTQTDEEVSSAVEYMLEQSR